MPLIQQPKRESEKLNGLIESFDVRGSMLVVGVNNEILSLSADSLQKMTDAMKFEQVHKNNIHNNNNSYIIILSLVLSKDGKYYLFTLIMYLCINYDLYVII